MFMKTKQKRKF